MLGTIPISQIVSVKPAVLKAAGAAVDLNGLLLTEDTAVPAGAVKSFASADDVANFFGATSPEAIAAVVYFNGYTIATRTPGILHIAQYNSTPVAAYTRGGSLKGVSLDTVKAVTGSLSVTVDGAQKTAASVNLTGATSFADAATRLSTALSALVTWDAVREAFVISSGTTGNASTISYVTGTAADGLMLSQAKGADLSQGADAATPKAYMDELVQITQNWALFTTAFEPDLAGKKEFAMWANGRGNRFGYVAWDTDVTAKDPTKTTSFGYWLRQNKVQDTVPVFGDVSHAMFVLGFAASLDFDRRNGRSTLAFKYQGGLTPSVTNASDAAGLEANGYNFFGPYAAAKENFNFMYSGAISGEWKWLDTFLKQIWLNANLQLAMVHLLMGVGSIPYNSEGYAMIEAACLDPINAAINFGAIRTGVALSESQKAQIRNALGRDASGTIFAKGYVLQIDPATAAIRSDRRSPTMTLYYADGGSVQRLNLASIAIQ